MHPPPMPKYHQETMAMENHPFTRPGKHTKSIKKRTGKWPSRNSWFTHYKWWFSIVISYVSLPEGRSMMLSFKPSIYSLFVCFFLRGTGWKIHFTCSLVLLPKNLWFTASDKPQIDGHGIREIITCSYYCIFWPYIHIYIDQDMKHDDTTLSDT